MTDPNLIRQKKQQLKTELVNMRIGLELIRDPKDKAFFSRQIEAAEYILVSSKPAQIASLNKLLVNESDPEKRAAIKESLRIVNED
jgi:hypothetical protein